MSAAAAGWALTVTAPGQLERVSVPAPTPADDEVVVAVTACGVGPEDRAIVAGGYAGAHLPLVLGREVVGVVDDVGAAVTGWRPGDRVAVGAERPCRRCVACLTLAGTACADRRVVGLTTDGGAARWLTCGPEQLVPLPPGLDDLAATRLAGRGPYGRAYRALAALGLDRDLTVVVRGLGPVGLAAVALAVLAGAEVVGIDPDPAARGRAQELGAELAADPGAPDLEAQLGELTDGGVLRALELSGTAAAVAETVALLRPGGRLVLAEPVGEPLPALPRELVVGHELELAGAGTPSVRDLGELLDLVAVDRLTVTEVGPAVELDALVGWLRGAPTDLAPGTAPVLDLRG